MNARELRIGNFIQDRAGKNLQIDWFERDVVCMNMNVSGINVHPLTEDIKYIKPIPLTEEWLFRFGLVKQLENGRAKKMKIWKCPIYKTSNGLNYGFTIYAFAKKLNILYVHQLQNLYFALTNNELQPKIL